MDEYEELKRINIGEPRALKGACVVRGRVVEVTVNIQ